MTCAVVVEDRASFGPPMVRQLVGMGVACQWMTHSAALGVRPDRWAGIDLVLLDAFDLDTQQSDPRQSRLVSLDLLERMPSVPHRPTVVVYSTAMTHPEVNIPLRGPGRAAAFYDVVGISQHLGAVVRGKYPYQVAPPAAGDWALLDPRLPAGADVAGAHQRMRTHARSWRQIWDAQAPFDKAAQVWINRNVLPMLGNPSGCGYALVVNVVRRVAGLPFTLA